MNATLENSEAAILDRVFARTKEIGLGGGAEAMLSIGFSKDDRQRMLNLLDKAKSGELLPDEAAALENYRHVGRLLELMKSKGAVFSRRAAKPVTNMARPDRTLGMEVVRRANGHCEYCHFPASASELPFHVDHIIAEKHGGPTISENLAWACFSCNLRKGPNIAGLDPVGGNLTRLFHPRSDMWNEHFEWDGSILQGMTAVGRATIAVLNINDTDSIAVRQSLRREGMFAG